LAGTYRKLPCMTKRIELTVSDEEFALIEEARGLVPRAAFIKAQLFSPVRLTAEARRAVTTTRVLDEPPGQVATGPRYAPKRAVAPIPKGKGK
jgi:hypothetical protein